MQKKKNLELMSPISSWESLVAACQAGADSVYFGLDSLNMRNRLGSKFTIEDLAKISQICKESGLKSYLTLNTVIYDKDMLVMRQIVDAAKANKIDAIIASDISVMTYAKAVDMNIHISTQCNISNIEAVSFYSQFADVLVLARELSLEQVKEIKKQVNERQIIGPNGELIRIEVFGHGALCMSISGKCYLSLHTYGTSANRGACVQNCRRKYIVIDKEMDYEFEVDNEYIMSAKDLCTISFIDKIIEAGVEVLKIEGRGRSADYVYTVTECYRQAIDTYNEGTYTKENIELWRNKLATVFNRGFWDGYYLGKTLGEWNDIYGSKATQYKIIIGRATNYFKNIGVAEFLLEAQELSLGDDIMIIGPTTGVISMKIEELWLNNKKVEQVKKGDVFTFSLSQKVRSSDKLFKLAQSNNTE